MKIIKKLITILYNFISVLLFSLSCVVMFVILLPFVVLMGILWGFETLMKNGENQVEKFFDKKEKL